MSSNSKINYNGKERDNYEVIQQIKKGGEGTVYKVKDKTTLDLLAMKEIRMEPEQKSEYETLQNLEHDYIMKPKKMFSEIDAQLKKTTLYLIHELMDMNLGEYFQKYRVQNKKLSEKELIRLIFILIESMFYLKTKLIAHRDVKPQNVLVKLLDNKLPSFFLIDFGVSKFADEVTQANSLVGTLSYLSPELLKAQKEGQTTLVYNPYKSDIFSLGLLILEGLTLKKINLLNEDEAKTKAVINGIGNQNLKEFILMMLEFDQNKRASLENLQIFMNEKLLKFIDFTIFDSGQKIEIRLAEMGTVHDLYKKFNQKTESNDFYYVFYYCQNKSILKLSWKDLKVPLIEFNLPSKCQLFIGPTTNERRYEYIVSYFFENVPLNEIDEKFRFIIKKTQEIGEVFNEKEICYDYDCPCKVTPQSKYLDNIDTLIIGIKKSVREAGRIYVILDGNHVKPSKFKKDYFNMIIQEIRTQMQLNEIEDFLQKKYDPTIVFQMNSEKNADIFYDLLEKSIKKLWKDLKIAKYGFLNENYLFLYESFKQEIIYMF